MSIVDLMFATIWKSACDCAKALAIYFGGEMNLSLGDDDEK